MRYIDAFNFGRSGDFANEDILNIYLISDAINHQFSYCGVRRNVYMRLNEAQAVETATEYLFRSLESGDYLSVSLAKSMFAVALIRQDDESVFMREEFLNIHQVGAAMYNLLDRNKIDKMKDASRNALANLELSPNTQRRHDGL